MKAIDATELNYLNMLLLQQQIIAEKMQGYLGFLTHKYQLQSGDGINPTPGIVELNTAHQRAEGTHVPTPAI